jgi:cytochrome P450
MDRANGRDRRGAAARAVGDQPRDLFDVLLAARDPETGAAFSQAQLRDHIATRIVAGHETTALTLFWSLYLLTSTLTKQSRLAQEVRVADLPIETAAAALPKLPYMRADLRPSDCLFVCRAGIYEAGSAWPPTAT